MGLQVLCAGAGKQGTYENWGHEANLFHSCRRGDLLVSRQSMIGVAPEGPYHMNYTGTPTERIENVRPARQSAYCCTAEVNVMIVCLGLYIYCF